MINEWMELFSEVATALNIPHRYTSVVRSRPTQDRLYRRRSASALPTARPGQSTHEYGLAFDVVARSRNRRDQEMLGYIGEQLGLYWGGRFQRPDPIHFQLVEPRAWSAQFA